VTDDKRKKGKRDRSRVAGGEPYEVEYEARKTKTSPSAVRKAIKQVGNTRKKVTKALTRRKKK
jgi:hypothetical protein